MAPPHSVSPTSSTVADTSCCHNHKDSSSYDAIISHPLEPLTKDEIQTAGIVAKKAYGDAIRFEMIVLKEPDKASVRAGEPVPRCASVSIYNVPEKTSGVTVLTIDLQDESITSIEQYETARPMISLEDFMLIEETVKKCPEFIEACQKRGITDIESVCVDPWSAGGDFGHPDEVGRHISHTFAWIKTSTNDNLYAHPIDGLNAVVDLELMKVIRVDDHEMIPIPQANCNYDREFVSKTRTDLKPINIEQPEGVSFVTQGRTIRWHEWSILVGFNAREAITLHNVSYAGRPVVYRASLAEMVVPYGSPRAPHYRKNVFDIGEYGIGKLANSLSLGCDCLGAIQYMDGWINDVNGDPMCIENAICIHEEDTGIQWKHWDFRTERTEVRRGRRLVISSVSTVGNYEYGSYWYFYLDGTMQFEMKATGIINTVACVPGEPQKYGTEVSPGVVGHIHQHLFCARLDMSIDGDENTVVECDTIAAPLGPENPHGNAFYVQETPLTTECGRLRNPEAERFWKFTNPNRKNHVGKPTAYKLEPMNSITPFNHTEGTTSSRMGFIRNHLWVTPFDAKEKFPAGEFVNKSDGSDSIETFVAKGRSIENTDIVAWHVFGLHHPVRLEDFPVQPVVTTGFRISPSGFFDRNPNLDLPYEKNKASCYVQQ